MAFSMRMKGKNGKDLLYKNDINHQLIGIAPSRIDKLSSDYNTLEEIREIFCTDDFGKKYSIEIFKRAVSLLQENLSRLQNRVHYDCNTCQCVHEIPRSWNIEMTKRFINIPEDEIYKISGGY